MHERELILGVLATQVRFATPTQVMQAASAALLDRDGPTLLARLEAAGVLTPKQRALLEEMADAAVAGSDGKPEEVLATLGGTEAISRTFGVGDATERLSGAAVSVDEPPIPWEREGQYLRLGEVGRGAQSVVLRALDRFIGREVALKEVVRRAVDRQTPPTPTAGVEARFLREVRLTAQLDHPGIVAIHELAQRSDGTLFCAEKLIRGQTLKAHLALCTSLQERLGLLHHLVDACHAMAYAHSRGVIHRDLKPSNVMVGPYGETVVVDWGLAKRQDQTEVSGSAHEPSPSPDPDLTVAGVAMGTPSYMSPEQARGAVGQIDQRSDVFSLGAMLYELLCGRVPFEGATNEEIIEKVRDARAPPVRGVCPAVPAELAAIAERALQPLQAARYQSAEALVKDLVAYGAGARVQAYEYGSWELLKKFVARNRRLSIATGAALLILAGSAANTWRQLRLSRANLAASLLERARDAELDSDWGRAAAYYGASRIERDSLEARWGYALARQRMPHRLFARRGPDRSSMDVAYLPDGRALVLAIEPPFVVGRELEGRRELWRFQPPALPRELLVLPAGQVVLFANDQRTYLDAATGRMLATFRRGEVSPCVSGSVPPPVVLTAEGLVTSGASPAQMLAPKLSPSALCAVSDDGRRVAFKDGDGTVHLWDLVERKELVARGAPDASQILFTSHGLALIRARAIQVFGGVEGDFFVSIPGRGGNGLMAVRGRGNVVSPDGHLLLTTRLTSNQADLVDLRKRTIVASFSFPAGTPRFTFSPSTDRLLVAGLLDGSVVAAWDLQSPRPELSGTGGPQMAIQSARDGSRFDVLNWGFFSSRVEVWDVKSALVHSTELGARANATLSGDGRRLAVTDASGLRVLDAVTGEPLFHVACEDCYRITLSHNGDRLLAWSAKRRLEVWDVAQARSLWSESTRVGISRDAIALAPDGKQLLWSKGPELFLASVDGGKEAQLHLDDGAEGVRFSYDGKRVAVVTLGSIGVWTADGLRPVWQVRNTSTVDQEVYWSEDDSALMVLYDSLGTQLIDSATGVRFANLSVTKPGGLGTQEVVLPSLRHRISRGDGTWEMWPLPAPDDGPPRESLERVLSEAGLEMQGVELIDTVPVASPPERSPASAP